LAYVSQIFFNLINNARHAIEKDGKITVTARPSSKRFVDVDITDTGSGIKPENMEKIWDPFFTTKPTVPQPGSKITGTGLGLPLVKRYMEAIGGLIHLQSEVGKGTTFTLSFIKVDASSNPAPTTTTIDPQATRAQA
jgi:signal transduction histidine kinase